MNLNELGYHSDLAEYRRSNGLDSFDVGRVIAEHKERYIVLTSEKEYDAELLGNLRYSAESRADLPAVGDWVAISEYDDDKGLIHAVFPRTTILERQKVGKQGEKQIIATNIDHALIVQAVDRDFSINRFERYLTICNEAKVDPILILNKIDLITEDELSDLIKLVRSRIKSIPIVAISNLNGNGLDDINNLLEKSKTYCLLGSSGVGKSTLLNSLSNNKIMKTAEISHQTNKGKHTTTHRELIILENGSLLIDNPGMRELGIADSTSGLEITFEEIQELAQECKFTDCTHKVEKGCAVLKAIEDGELDKNIYDNFMRMQRETAHYESTIAERRQKDKAFGKMAKEIIQGKNRNKRI